MLSTRRGPSLLPLALLVGCAATSPQAESTDERRVSFACSDGSTIEMWFFLERGVGVLVRDGKTVELQQKPVASGILYTNGPTTVRGKGDDLTLKIGRIAPIACKAR